MLCNSDDAKVVGFGSMHLPQSLIYGKLVWVII